MSDWKDFWKAGLQVMIPCLFAFLAFVAFLAVIPAFIWAMRHIP